LRTVCTIEARMTSSRLPGKVLLDAAGQPLLAHMIERLRRARTLDAIVIATTEEAASDPIVALAEDLSVGCFRGSEEDVLGRVLGAARAHGAELIVETTGDCPLIDPGVVDLIVGRFRDGGVDYCSNTLERTYPRGMDVQAFPFAVLEEVDRLTDDPADREHVSLYIYEHPERYRLVGIEARGRRRRPDLRLTLDTAVDLAVIRAVYEALWRENPAFTIEDVIDYLDAYPELAELNRSVATT
jgi:spore coat polysaccharide biosynthesis protein SpsF